MRFARWPAATAGVCLMPLYAAAWRGFREPAAQCGVNPGYATPLLSPRATTPALISSPRVEQCERLADELFARGTEDRQRLGMGVDHQPLAR